VSCQPSLDEVLACFFAAVALFAGSLIPFFLLVDADPSDFDPRPLVRRGRRLVRDAAVSVTALLMICTAPALEATR
jgi:hypothetical protein